MPDQYLNFDIEAFDYHKDGAGGERFSVRMTEPRGFSSLQGYLQIGCTRFRGLAIPFPLKG